MDYGNKWEPGILPDELKNTYGEKIKGYYKWKLKTYAADYAHVFYCILHNQNELRENWKDIVANIAVYVQSEITSLLERSNFYIWFFVKGYVEHHLIKEIEDNTYSSRKFVAAQVNDCSEQEKLDIIKRKLFAFDLEVQKSESQMITRVELQNFRIYKGKWSFDFNTGRETARLVVLFAPNGMGKTSFFDSIEWGLSGEVGRFAGIADKNVYDKRVLKNEEAGGESAYVKIYQEGNHWIRRKVTELSSGRHKDYGQGYVKCSKNNILEEYLSETDKWVDSILPHHKIEGFISGMKPTDLYIEWGSLWDIDGGKRRLFETAYEKKRQAGKQYDSKKEKYEEVKEKYEKVKNNRRFVEKLEKDIAHFREVSESTVIGDLDFSAITASDYVNWSNLVDREFSEYEKQSDILENKCGYIQKDMKKDIEQLFVLFEKEKKNILEQEKIQKYLTKCRQKKLLNTKKEELKKEADKQEKQISELNFLKEKGEEWYQNARQYFNSNAVAENIENTIIELQERLSYIQKEDDKLSVRLEHKETERKEESEYKLVIAHADELAEFEKRKKILAEKSTEYNNRISGMQKRSDEEEYRIAEIKKAKIADYESIGQWCMEEYPAILLKTELEKIRNQLIESVHKAGETEKKLAIVEQQILAEEQIEDKIKNILEQSRIIIKEKNLTHCPVCNSDFKTVQELINSTYRIHSQEGEKKKEEKIKLEKELSDEKNNIENQIEIYNQNLDILIKQFEKQKEQHDNEFLKIRYEKKEIEKEMKSISENADKIQRSDQDKGIFVVYVKEGIEKWKESWETRLDKEITDLKADILKNDELKKMCQVNITSCRKRADEVKKLILQMESQTPENYTRMKNAETAIKSHEYSTLPYELQRQEIIWKKTEQKLNECNDQLDKLQDILVPLEEDYGKHNAELQNEKKENDEAFYHVKKRIENVLAVEVSIDADISAEHLNSMAEKSMNVFLQDKKHIRECMESLSRLKYNREVENYFNEFKKLERKLKNAEDEYVSGKESLEKTEKEYTLQKQIIETEMDEFLKTYSMGEIYEMLEPHEKLKHLAADFSFNENDKPGLSFHVVGEEGKTYPPAWYLSTAQLNVVAFSIFLGRALQRQSAPLKSIFIDDPVGHFDEMNIVGFVDLLRKILENTDRQLIMSTHEERVFGLIKRKMPEESYPVRYIDFREMSV